MTEWKVMEQFQDVVSHLKDVVIILESDRVTVSISECHALKLLFKRWNWKFTSHFLLIYSDYVANIIHFQSFNSRCCSSPTNTTFKQQKQLCYLQLRNSIYNCVTLLCKRKDNQLCWWRRQRRWRGTVIEKQEWSDGHSLDRERSGVLLKSVWFVCPLTNGTQDCCSLSLCFTLHFHRTQIGVSKSN